MCAGPAASSIPSRSFHSWHATSQALHPMQVVVSMSLATCGACRTPVGGAGLAEMRLSSMLLGINPRIVFSFQFSVLSFQFSVLRLSWNGYGQQQTHNGEIDK